MDPEPKRHYPVYLDLDARFVVIVGGDELADKRARGLLKAGADVTVISPDPCQGLRQLEAGALVNLERRPYVRGDLNGAFLVFCTVENPEVRRAVFAEADSQGTLVSIHGDTTLSNFIVPGTVRRGPLQIAVSTGGTAPAAARVVRRAVKERFDAAWGEWIGLLGGVHALALERLDSPADAAGLMEAVTAADLIDRLRAGEELTAEGVYSEFGPEPAVETEDEAEQAESVGEEE